jgi:hypothetical protein
MSGLNVTSAADVNSPWPYLDSMFKVKSVDKKTVRFVCLLCAPKHTECSAYLNSPSNLKKHIEVLLVWISGHCLLFSLLKYIGLSVITIK